MLKKEIGCFFIVGLLAVTLDLIVYRFLFLMNILNIENAKAMGFILGSLFAFIANKTWTFEQKTFDWFQLVKFSIQYSLSCSVNVWINTTLLYSLNGGFTVFIAFILATGVSTIMNFIGMKWFVFKAPSYKVIEL